MVTCHYKKKTADRCYELRLWHFCQPEKIWHKSAVFNAACAWRKVPPTTIIKSWKKLWPSHSLLSENKNKDNWEVHNDHNLNQDEDADLALDLDNHLQEAASELVSKDLSNQQMYIRF